MAPRSTQRPGGEGFLAAVGAAAQQAPGHSRVADLLLSDSGEALRTAGGQRMAYDADDTTEPLAQSKWWQASAKAVRLSVLEHIERSNAREVVNEQLRVWAANKVQQYGQADLDQMDLVDVDQIDMDDAGPIEPTSSGFASDIKRCWEARIQAEVDERLEAAKILWERAMQAEMSQMADLRAQVKDLETELEEEASESQRLAIQVAKVMAETERLRMERENERRLRQEDALAIEAERREAREVKPVAVTMPHQVQSAEDIEALHSRADDSERLLAKVQRQLDDAAVEAKGREAALKSAHEKSALLEAQLHAHKSKSAGDKGTKDTKDKGAKDKGAKGKGAKDKNEDVAELTKAQKEANANGLEALKWKDACERLIKEQATERQAAQAAVAAAISAAKPPPAPAHAPSSESSASVAAQKAAAQKAAALEARTAELDAQVARLQKQVQALQAEKAASTKDADKLSAEDTRLRGELDASTLREASLQQAVSIASAAFTAESARTAAALAESSASAATVQRSAAEALPPQEIFHTLVSKATGMSEGSEASAVSVALPAAAPSPQLLASFSHCQQRLAALAGGLVTAVTEDAQSREREASTTLHNVAAGRGVLQAAGGEPTCLGMAVLHAAATCLRGVMESCADAAEAADIAEEEGLQEALDQIKVAAHHVAERTTSTAAILQAAAEAEAAARAMQVDESSKRVRAVSADLMATRVERMVYAPEAPPITMDWQTRSRFTDTFTPWNLEAAVASRSRGPAPLESEVLTISSLTRPTRRGRSLSPESLHPKPFYRSGFAGVAPPVVTLNYEHRPRSHSPPRARAPLRPSSAFMPLHFEGEDTVAESKDFATRRATVANPQKGFRNPSASEDIPVARRTPVRVQTQTRDAMATLHMRPVRGIVLERLDRSTPTCPYSPYRHLQEQQRQTKQLYYSALNDARSGKVVIAELEKEVQRSRAAGLTLVAEKQNMKEELNDLRRSMLLLSPLPGTAAL